MKKILFLAIFIASTFSLSAQKGAAALVGHIGYQTEYERFAISGQGRYNLTNALRIAPDVTFFVPNHKVTGLDVNVNLHYAFNFGSNGNFSFYPLAGIGMQNNFYGKRHEDGAELDSKTTTDLSVNLGAGISYNVSARGFLNAEGKFMFGDRDSGVIMIGYGYRF